MSEKKKIKKVKESKFVKEDIANIYEHHILKRLKEKVKKGKLKNEKKSKELLAKAQGKIRIIRFS